MASLFDQYEQASARSSSFSRPQRPQVSTNQEPKSTGFINDTMEDDIPIFNKQKIEFSPPAAITHMQVCNNYLILAMKNNKIFRLDLRTPDNPEDIEVTVNHTDVIHNIFLDPLGKHLLVSMKSGEVIHLSRNSKKPRLLSRMKGHLIESIAWNRAAASESSSGEILIGTNKGLIFECELLSVEESKFFQANVEQYFKQVYDLGQDTPTPITGLVFERLQTTDQILRRFFIVITTPARIYTIIGDIPVSSEPPVFSVIFAGYEGTIPRFTELPGDFGYSQLCLLYSRYKGAPQSFAWMAGPGVYYGNVNNNVKTCQDILLMDPKLVPYPHDDFEIKPRSIVMTNFHMLLVYPNSVKVVCTLNEQLVFEDNFPLRNGDLLGMVQDPVRGLIWTFTDHCVYKYKVIREDRDVWKIYLDKGQYELAKEYCQDNPASMNEVLTKEAEHLFQNKKYEESALFYAMTKNSFEDVALKFIHVEQDDALKIFLKNTLGGLKKEDKAQKTMLVIWLLEILLNQLSSYKQKFGDDGDKYKLLHESFHTLIQEPQIMDNLTENKNAIYDLIGSHGNIDDLIFFACMMQDYDRVISHHIQQKNYDKALETLENQFDLKLYYKFSSTLIQHSPQQTVTAWMNQGSKLDPKRFISALVQHGNKNKQLCNEAVRYLEFCVKTLKTRDQAIHNYLFSLYVMYKPDELMNYLRYYGQVADLVCYDLKYGLRLCLERGLKEASVHIYSTLGLYEEAVDLALQVDVEIAKANADNPDDDDDLRKKLWLRIARHVIEEEKDVKRAMESLHQCELLKIEDILPFFPDFVTIDHFKEAICDSLAEYNQHIEGLKEKMCEATDSAKQIRADITSVRSKYNVVKAVMKCSECSLSLMEKPFYLFPCQHAFHSDCLVDHVWPHLKPKTRVRVRELQSKLEHELLQTPITNADTVSLTSNISLPQRDTTKDELDQIVASECLYCGQLMIRSINKPFINMDKFTEVMESWR